MKIVPLWRRYEVSSGFRIRLHDTAEPTALLNTPILSGNGRGAERGRDLRSIRVGIDDQNPHSALRQRAREARAECCLAVARLCRSDEYHLLAVQRLGSSESSMNAHERGAEPGVGVVHRVILRR